MNDDSPTGGRHSTERISTDLEPTVRNVGQQIVRTAEQQALDASARLGSWLAAAESGSNDTKAKQMAASLRVEYARLLGLPPHASSEVYVIKGHLTLSSKLLRALAYKHGLRVIRKAETAESCTAAVVRLDGTELGETTFTLAQAKKMGIANGTNWTNNTDRMLWARASKRALDDFAPWVTVGILTTEDIDDDPESDPVPFDSDEVLEGEVVT